MKEIDKNLMKFEALAEVWEIMEEEGVVLRGHFLLSSGLHTNLYINKDKILTISVLRKWFISQMSVYMHRVESKTDIIVGASASTPWAAIMSSFFNLPLAYAEKADDKMVFRKAFHDSIKDKNVVVIEDIVTTGGSLFKIKEAIEKLGGKYIRGICLFDRSGLLSDDMMFLHSVIAENFEQWEPDNCPECKENNKLQSPKDFK